ncbi:MAG: GNAT family N-acetyltransferase [Clostridium sp.]
MIRLIDINENNWLKIARLQVKEEQKAFVASPTGIMARAYAMRASNAHALAISNEEEVVGVFMVREFQDEPVGYELQQLLIDYRFQNKGYGKQAVQLIIEKLKQEGKYNSVEVCVKMEDDSAIRVYKKLGFVDSGYIDPEVPDSYNLIYRFN